MATADGHTVDSEKARHLEGDPPMHDEKLDKQNGQKFDGDIENEAPMRWTFRRVIAIFSLCLVYVGML